MTQAFAGALLVLLSSLLPTIGLADSTHQPSITLIIDDMGNNLRLGQRALRLPGPVTYAFLPHSNFGRRLAHQGHLQHKEIMLHMPMSNHHDHPLGPGALTHTLDRDTFELRLQAALQDIPFVQGINNHMGSRLTQDSQRMQWLMSAIARQTQPLYFVDSRTSAATVAETTARAHQLPNLRRDIFLDHEATLPAIDRQFKQLLQRAREQGFAVGIGHPYPATLGYLETVIPKLNSMGVRLVSASGLLTMRQQQRTTHKAKSNTPAQAAYNDSHCQRIETSTSIHFHCAASSSPLSKAQAGNDPQQQPDKESLDPA